jgi:hypothetical protein
MNNCPLASTCPTWARYRRDLLLVELISVAGGYTSALRLMQQVVDGGPLQGGLGLLLAMELHKTGANLPSTKPALSRMLSKSVALAG